MMEDDLKREQLADWLRVIAERDPAELRRLVAAFDDGLFNPQEAYIVNGRLIGPCRGGGKVRTNPQALRATT